MIANSGLVSTIPSCIKTILSVIGYNSAYSIITITDEKLDELEKYIEENEREVIDSIDIYKSKKPFVFLPGHRALIFGIKEELLKRSGLSGCGNKKSKFDHLQNLDVNELRVSLQNQLTNYTAGLGMKITFVVNEVTLVETNNSTFYKGLVVCPICGTTINLKYATYWKISNATKHVRLHGEKATKISTNASTNVMSAKMAAAKSAVDVASNGLPSKKLVKGDDYIDEYIVYDPNEENSGDE